MPSPALEERYKALRADVRARGLYERRYGYYALYCLLVCLGIGASLYAITITDNVVFQLFNAFFFGIISVQAGMFGHDLSHQQVFKSEKRNRFWAMIAWGLMGGLSEGNWYTKHSAHHEAPNQVDHDPDLGIPFIFDEHQLEGRSLFFKKWILPYQHIFFFLILPFIYLSWVIFSMRHLFQNMSARTVFELMLMVIHFAILFGFVFYSLPLPTALLFCAVLFTVGGAYMSLVFAPNHKGEEIISKDATYSWLNQITSTRNLRPSSFIFHIFGGLNFQVEHHLFPNVPRINYPHLHPLIKTFCTENNIPYHETSWLGSMKEIYYSLKTHALQARASATQLS